MPHQDLSLRQLSRLEDPEIWDIVKANLEAELEGHPRSIRAMHNTWFARDGTTSDGEPRFTLIYYRYPIAHIDESGIAFGNNGHVTLSTQKRYNWLLGKMGLPFRMYRHASVFSLGTPSGAEANWNSSFGSGYVVFPYAYLKNEMLRVLPREESQQRPTAPTVPYLSPDAQSILAYLLEHPDSSYLEIANNAGVRNDTPLALGELQEENLIQELLPSVGNPTRYRVTQDGRDYARMYFATLSNEEQGRELGELTDDAQFVLAYVIRHPNSTEVDIARHSGAEDAPAAIYELVHEAMINEVNTPSGLAYEATNRGTTYESEHLMPNAGDVGIQQTTQQALLHQNHFLEDGRYSPSIDELRGYWDITDIPDFDDLPIDYQRRITDNRDNFETVPTREGDRIELDDVGRANEWEILHEFVTNREIGTPSNQTEQSPQTEETGRRFLFNGIAQNISSNIGVVGVENSHPPRTLLVFFDRVHSFGRENNNVIVGLIENRESLATLYTAEENADMFHASLLGYLNDTFIRTEDRHLSDDDFNAKIREIFANYQVRFNFRNAVLLPNTLRRTEAQRETRSSPSFSDALLSPAPTAAVAQTVAPQPAPAAVHENYPANYTPTYEELETYYRTHPWNELPADMQNALVALRDRLTGVHFLQQNASQEQLRGEWQILHNAVGQPAFTEDELLQANISSLSNYDFMSLLDSYGLSHIKVSDMNPEQKGLAREILSFNFNYPANFVELLQNYHPSTDYLYAVQATFSQIPVPDNLADINHEGQGKIYFLITHDPAIARRWIFSRPETSTHLLTPIDIRQWLTANSLSDEQKDAFRKLGYTGRQFSLFPPNRRENIYSSFFNFLEHATPEIKRKAWRIFTEMEPANVADYTPTVSELDAIYRRTPMNRVPYGIRDTITGIRRYHTLANLSDSQRKDEWKIIQNQRIQPPLTQTQARRIRNPSNNQIKEALARVFTRPETVLKLIQLNLNPNADDIEWDNLTELQTKQYWAILYNLPMPKERAIYRRERERLERELEQFPASVLEANEEEKRRNQFLAS